MSRAELLSRVGRYGGQTPDKRNAVEQRERRERLSETDGDYGTARESIMGEIAEKREQAGVEDPELVGTLDEAEVVLTAATHASKAAASKIVAEHREPSLRERHESAFTEALGGDVSAPGEELEIYGGDEDEEIYGRFDGENGRWVKTDSVGQVLTDDETGEPLAYEDGTVADEDAYVEWDDDDEA